MPSDRNNIQIQTLSNEHIEPVIECLARAFTRENQHIALGLKYEDQQALFRILVPVCASEGLSQVAVNSKTGQVCGVILNRDFDAEPLDEHPLYQERCSKPFAPIDAAIHKLDEEFVEQLRNRKYLYHVVDEADGPGTVLHILFLAVCKDFAGQGIAHMLVQRTLQIARAQGYSAVVAEASGPGSQKVFRQQGFDTWYELRYDSFEFPPQSGNKPFATINDTDAFQLVVKTITSSRL